MNFIKKIDCLMMWELIASLVEHSYILSVKMRAVFEAFIARLNMLDVSYVLCVRIICESKKKKYNTMKKKLETYVGRILCTLDLA